MHNQRYQKQHHAYPQLSRIALERHIDRVDRQAGAAAEVDRHLAGNALRNALLRALGVAFMRRAGTLRLVHLGALLETPTDAVNRALARLRLRGKRAVTASISFLAQASPVVAVPVLGAIVQTSADIASISRPAGVAIALALNALPVATAALSVTRATSITMSTTPSIDTRALAVEALSMTRAPITLLVLFTVTMAMPLGTIVTGVALVRADTLHLISNGNTDTIAGA